ncbi:voltage-dependent N-type calcium channel subunit alpha-1B-like isoform X1, partial [Paramuricea clavata]
EIIIREEQNEDERQAQAARRIQETMLHKRHSLSESFMNLIDGNKELLNHLNSCRKDAQSNLSNKTEALRKLKQKIKKCRLYVRQTVRSSVFYWSVILCVFLNTMVIALEHHGQPEFLTQFQDTCELVFLVIFIAEMLFKMFGLGFHTYFASAFNCFDFTVVLCGLVEMMIQEVQGISLGISVLRSLRLLRIFKVTRFNNKLDPPRTNFDNFFQAMLAVFQMLSGEDWNTVMYEGILASGGPYTVTGILASFYFIGLVILGNYTLLNVFLAIAVDNLATAQALTRDEEREQRERDLAKKRIQEKRQKGWLKAKKQLPIILTFKHFSNLRNAKLAEQQGGSGRSSIEDTVPTTSPDDVAIQFNGTSDTNVRAGIYEVTEEQNGASQDGQDEEVVRKISFVEILQQVRDRDVQERQLGMDEDAEGMQSGSDYIEQGISHHGFSTTLRNPEKIIGRRLIARRVPIIRKTSLFIFSPENP